METKRLSRPRKALLVSEAEARQILMTHALREAGVLLGISYACAWTWRHWLGIGNPHVPYTRRMSGPVPWSKGLTWPAIEAALAAHPEGLHLGVLARELGCSRQAVHQQLLKWERRGLVRGLYEGYRRRRGWVLREGNQEKGTR
jgi:hypothetical protein